MSPRFGRGGGGGADDREARHRSTDERERARQEREERRAAREGRPPRELPPLPTEPPRVAPPAPPEPVRSESSPPGGADPDLSVEEPLAPEPPAAPEPSYAPEPPAASEPSYAPEPPAAPEPLYAPEPPAASEPAHAPEPLAAREPAPPQPEPTVRTESAPSGGDGPDLTESESTQAFAPLDPPQPPAAPQAREGRRERRTREERERVAGIPPTRVTKEAAEPEWADTSDEPAVRVQGRSDEPAGVKRVAASSLASSAGADGPPRFGAPPRGVPKRRRGVRKVLPVLLLIVLAAVGYFAYSLFQPGKGEGVGTARVTIPAGANAEQIGDLLAKADVIDSSFFFGLRARLDGRNLRAGKIALPKKSSYAAVLDELTKPAKPAPVLAKITLPEGPGRRELAERVQAAGFKGGYLAASRRSNAIRLRDYGAPRAATLEGFLFPATYELKPGSSAKALVNAQVRAFEERFGKLDMSVARRAGFSRFDVVTIASMIEREALVPKDRRLIAGVIYNRIRQDIPLYIDATSRYELGNFSRPLKQSELDDPTPYNTRLNAGLPPGPIGNPGEAALAAAANPAKNDFIYYVVKPCANGAHTFTATKAQFDRAVAAYNAKRDELGGKDPSQCPG